MFRNELLLHIPCRRTDVHTIDLRVELPLVFRPEEVHLFPVVRPNLIQVRQVIHFASVHKDRLQHIDRFVAGNRLFQVRV